MTIEMATMEHLDKPFQILDYTGQLVDEPPALPSDKLMAMLRYMWLARTFSDKIIALQRQGRATTWGSLTGQEASAVGVAMPLQPQDWLAGSYREVGAYMVKGIAPRAFMRILRGYPPNEHYSKDAHCLPHQIVIGTQTLHAVGLAMAAKISGDNAVAVGVCGDGATSEGDFNEALNFAGVFKAPAVMVVVNNGWAISMPRRYQSAAKTLASRGVGFGVPAYVVDGNDVLAVYKLMSEAADRARAGDGPTLIECLTYRIGAHTTSDDPTRYVPREDLAYWKERDPITRFSRYLHDRAILDEDGEKQLIAEVEQQVADAVAADEAEPLPAPDVTFDLTFANLSPRLQKQRAEMQAEIQFQQEKGAH